MNDFQFACYRYAQCTWWTSPTCSLSAQLTQAASAVCPRPPWQRRHECVSLLLPGLPLSSPGEVVVGEGVLVEEVESWLQVFSSSAASRDLPLPRRL